jgi:nucleoside-diphosphate-sugar epimerase
MRVFLTGATGFIGGTIAERLRAGGHEVVGLARSEGSAAKLRELGYSVQRGDLEDAPNLAKGAREADGVIHAAATDSYTHLVALNAVLPAIAGTGKPLVYTSGSLIYGETGPEPVGEDAPTSRDFVPFHIVNEGLVLDPAWGIRGSSIRVPLAFGRGGGNLQVSMIELARRMGAAVYVGAGENRWSTVYVEDLADLYVRSLERAAAGAIFNAASGDISMADWALAISHAVGLPGETVSWSPAEGRRRLDPRGVFELNQLLDGSRARRELGWDPRGPRAFEEFAHGSYRQAVAV